jgi:hypothetical protein
METINPLAVILGALVLVAMAAPTRAAPQPGGYADAQATNAWVKEAAAFAVEAQGQTTATNERPVLVELVSARQQVVAGLNYRLTLKVKAGGVTKEAEAVVWRKLDGEYRLTSWTWK